MTDEEKVRLLEQFPLNNGLLETPESVSISKEACQVMRHYINNKLVGVLGFAEIGRKSGDNSEKDACFEKINSNAEAIKDCVNFLSLFVKKQGE